MKELASNCPSCYQTVENDPFYCCTAQPANSVMLCQSLKEATGIDRGDVLLVHCPACGFIFNAAYDPQVCIYDRNYEETQAHSDVFNSFNHELASRLLKSYQLRNKIILEIGCGKGDFLNLLCRKGNNRGIGYDPSYVAERSQTILSEKVTFCRRLFPEKYDGEQADCIICKMTLEHIPDVHHFLGCVRRSIAPGNRPTVFFQVPNARPILEESKFWDIYYEHCSYFTRESLVTLFQQCGFNVIAVTNGYDQQYLMIEALPTDTPAAERVEIDQGYNVGHLVDLFSVAVREHIRRWQQLLQAWHAQNKKVVLWGGGSKAVAFLETLKCPSTVDFVVDINPHKQGRYLPGSGHRVVAPESLVEEHPDVILAMNPVYMEEIKNHLTFLDIKSELIPLSNESKELDTN